ncbi:MAG: hypothetical protein ACI8PB_001914 [Desulforhopalus sp.]|jgi:hypothetical protein
MGNITALQYLRFRLFMKRIATIVPGDMVGIEACCTVGKAEF